MGLSAASPKGERGAAEGSMAKAWSRMGTELNYPAETADYEANPQEISTKK